MKNYFQDILDRFASQRYSAKLEQDIQHWLTDENHANEKDEALFKVWENTRAKVDASTQASLQQVYSKAHVTEHSQAAPNRRRSISRLWINFAAAAAILVAISISATYYLTQQWMAVPKVIEHLTRAGETSTMKLPDGTEVTTNSGSILLYPEQFKNETRTVYLIGEANFKVAKNKKKPFIVRSTSVAVTALGTEFNLTSYAEDDEIVTTLIEGKVRVDCNNGKDSFMLVSGQQVRYNKQTGMTKLQDAELDDVTAWQQGIIVFRSSTISEVLNTLHKRFAVDFEYNESLFNDDRFNFRFHKDDSLRKVLTIIKQVAGGFDFKVEGKQCKLTKAKP